MNHLTIGKRLGLAFALVLSLSLLTIAIVLWQMEAWGFCGFGESGDFVLDGAM